ncbi:hypothetical protein SAMN02927900_03066 [Rhizobium mongolense subsp. loessense]|uniref:Uncharacterized protein n=1 Tax=Rhizobium mongolense subsp. loessense TaxID=158890 RepID=A0A1G4RW04_9HYPH|nr:hypothetical protein SAMN02927900_03066 [Rhizobium mongolense subsp. loessense]
MRHVHRLEKEMRRSARWKIASWNRSVQSGVRSGAFPAIVCRPDELLADNAVPASTIRPAAFPGSRALGPQISTLCSPASWASDRFAVESNPAQRWLAGSPRPLGCDEVMSARKALDGDMKPKSARECAAAKTAPDRPQSHHALAGMLDAVSADAMLCRHNDQHEKGDSACQPP